MSIVPVSTPRLSRPELMDRLAANNTLVDESMFPFYVVGIRGYYKKSMGDPLRNDRGLYDDAVFIVSPSAFIAYNANTDPSFVRKGRGVAEGIKGMARLKAGIYFVHKFDLHKTENGQHEALCQRLGNVTVIRDGLDGDYEHTGMFGINIHRGGKNGTVSEGCQTIYRPQWKSFYQDLQNGSAAVLSRQLARKRDSVYFDRGIKSKTSEANNASEVFKIR